MKGTIKIHRCMMVRDPKLYRPWFPCTRFYVVYGTQSQGDPPSFFLQHVERRRCVSLNVNAVDVPIITPLAHNSQNPSCLAVYPDLKCTFVFPLAEERQSFPFQISKSLPISYIQTGCRFQLLFSSLVKRSTYSPPSLPWQTQPTFGGNENNH